MMNKLKPIFIIALLWTSIAFEAKAHFPPGEDPGIKSTQTTHREDCAESVSQADLDINNVRARLLGGGDMWWDLSDGKYVIPAVEPGSGIDEVSSIFAGAVWLGGFDDGDNLKTAAQTYRGGGNDFWPGPINPATGGTDAPICLNWDKFFEVLGSEIDEHKAKVKQIIEIDGGTIDAASIPNSIKGWPSRGNPFFLEIHQFPLPNQELADFFDYDGDEEYDPTKGDFPMIGIRGCAPQTMDDANYGDKMIFWVYNDVGAAHTQTDGQAIRMEVQVQAFAFATNDEINDMSFYRFKLINRANQSIKDTYFGMWVDPDLGCPDDDLIGCDAERSMAVVYNAGTFDGPAGVDCLGATTYGPNVPVLGYDYFRGPLAPKDFGPNGDLVDPPAGAAESDTIIELGMSSFTYYFRSDLAPNPGMGDPNGAVQYYNYLSGKWADGTQYTIPSAPTNPPTNESYGYGGSGPNLDYAFPGNPNDPDAWSMCTYNIPSADLRSVQASGPFRLEPGRTNELILGVVWVPDVIYPCPDINKIQNADDIAQSLFNNCFDLIDGPDAPDVDIIELKNQLVLVLSNDSLISNNANEAYEEFDPTLPGAPSNTDTTYVFEGYLIYQLINPSVSNADLTDPEKARVVFQVDVQNGVSKLFNWSKFEDEDVAVGDIFTPELMVAGEDGGIRNTFSVTEDQFAPGDRGLINHKKYYFMAIAYAYNNYEEFDIASNVGQKNPFLVGRGNISQYVGIPRDNSPEYFGTVINANYGDGPIITRLDGVGNGGNYLKLSEETTNEIVANGSADRLVYDLGAGPIDVIVYDPLRVAGGNYQVRIFDNTPLNDNLTGEINWELKDLTNSTTWTSVQPMNTLNEQLIPELGLSMALVQVPDAGVDQVSGNGYVGSEIDYINGTSGWFYGVNDEDAEVFGFFTEVINFLRVDGTEEDFPFDEKGVYTNVAEGMWAPFKLCNCRKTFTIGGGNPQPYFPYLSPGWIVTSNFLCQGVRGPNPLEDLNNVDVYFTSNKDLWSRCVVVESASSYYTGSDATTQDMGLVAEGGREQFDLRAHPSVGKFDEDGDGLPDEDGDGEGMGWFPGYAIDVETGKRVNIFFGENSIYSSSSLIPGVPTNGGDMMWNPSDQVFQDLGGPGLEQLIELPMAAQHYVYVTNTEYDSCNFLRSKLVSAGATKIAGLKTVTWASMPILPTGSSMRSYRDGLIPGDLKFELRVGNPYEVQFASGNNDGYPTYEFSLDGLAVTKEDATAAETALDLINVVPNPYYSYSEYEISQFTNTVKITNLPPTCNVTIYTLDGKYIRQYKRAEAPNQIQELGGSDNGVIEQQILTSIDWDMKNSQGIPVAAGVYLMHVDAPGVGERVIKWFGIPRKFDPSGL